jgi:hypothetical protein
MKIIKTTLIIAITMLIVSCRKDRSCECSVSSGGASNSATYNIPNSKRKDAQIICNNYKSSYNWESCTIK